MYIPFPCSRRVDERLDAHQSKLNSLYGDLDTSSKINLLVPILFMAKRIIFCLCTFVLKVPAFNIQVFIHATMANLLFISAYKPFTSSRIYNLEIFNEIVTMIFCYLLFAFQDPMGGGEDDFEKYGWICISILLTYLVVHIVTQIKHGCYNCKLKCKRKYFERK
jgi:hypothetical protein